MPSILQLQRVATCGPYDPQAYLDLCRALVAEGRRDYAASIFRRWEHADPGNSVIAYYRCALLQEKTLARVPEAYLLDEFDAFADSFDGVLAKLGYRVPDCFAGLLAQRLGRDATRRVIDLGCGTGLCGLVARPYASTLCGVDVSPRMLERAHVRRLYDELVESDIVAYLDRCGQRFDLLMAGDCLEYFGDLQPVFAAVRRALVPGALLLLSFELGDDDDGFELPPSGRFRHGQTYVEATLRGYGFEMDHLERTVLRHECGMPVLGLIVVARSNTRRTDP
jgi:predicted TPR repeat methyltransferase